MEEVFIWLCQYYSFFLLFAQPYCCHSIHLTKSSDPLTNKCFLIISIFKVFETLLRLLTFTICGSLPNLWIYDFILSARSLPIINTSISFAEAKESAAEPKIKALLFSVKFCCMNETISARTGNFSHFFIVLSFSAVTI